MSQTFAQISSECSNNFRLQTNTWKIRMRNDLHCVEWDVKLYYTIPYHTIGNNNFQFSKIVNKNNCKFSLFKNYKPRNFLILLQHLHPTMDCVLGPDLGNLAPHLWMWLFVLYVLCSENIVKMPRCTHLWVDAMNTVILMATTREEGVVASTA